MLCSSDVVKYVASPNDAIDPVDGGESMDLIDEHQLQHNARGKNLSDGDPRKPIAVGSGGTCGRSTGSCDGRFGNRCRLSRKHREKYKYL